ncbi:hypothetical protein [Anatilimnocola floriformis]|uniref:hypothetical protein n=1 Tax=Anatilimnocola floriformis TaxID=2948575 RepID=UPI0020C53297|nr:hypothetical protein [Anatilimnocola floriformis]
MTEPEDDDSEYDLAPLEGEQAHAPKNQPAAGGDYPVQVQVRTKPGAAAPRRKRSSPIYELIGVVVGGVMGLSLGVLLLTYVFKIDPFGLFPPAKKAPEATPAVAPATATNPSSAPSGSGQIPGPPPQIPGPPSPQVPGPPAPQVPGPP